MMNGATGLLVLVFIGFSSFGQAAVKAECAAATWDSHSITQDGMWEGTINSDCTITGATGHGIEELDAFEQKDAVNDVKVIQPMQESTYEDLPAHNTIVSAYFKDSQMTVVSLIHLATQDDKVLIYQAFSKEIQAPGLAGNTRKLDNRIEVTRVSQGSYKVRFISVIWFQKPHFFPAFQFFAERTSMENFNQHRDLTFDLFAKNL